jgi:hypothetical protein
VLFSAAAVSLTPPSSLAVRPWTHAEPSD